MNKPKIIVGSQKLQNGKYVPHIILRFINGPTTTERPLTWDKEFNTKEEADKYALLQAEFYLKKHYYRKLNKRSGN